jgi:hypothetical protein
MTVANLVMRKLSRFVSPRAFIAGYGESRRPDRGADNRRAYA